MRPERVVSTSCLALVLACSSFHGSSSPPDDGGVAADAAQHAPCAQGTVDPAHFCDDFDDLRGPVTAHWQAVDTSDGAALGPTDAALSPPRALAASHPAGSDLAYARVRYALPSGVDFATKKRLALSFAIRFDRPPSASSSTLYTEVAVVDFGGAECTTVNGTNERDLEVVFGRGNVVVAAKGLLDCSVQNNYFNVPGGFTATDFVDRFRRISIELTKTPCGDRDVSLVFSVDGIAQPCTPIDIDPFAKAQSVTLVLGPLSGGGGYADVAAVYDDVHFDVE